MAETWREHGARTLHRIYVGIETPWYCEDCPARSPLYGLATAPDKGPYTARCSECLHLLAQHQIRKPACTHMGCSCLAYGTATQRDSTPAAVEAERVLTNLPPGSGTATSGDYPANEENR